MNGLNLETVLNINKLSKFFTAPLLTVLVLVFVLMRNIISEFIIKKICKALEIEREKINTKNRHLKLFIIAIGIYFILKIWSKDLVLINKVLKITKIIGIFTIARITSYFISPEILKTKKQYFNINDENFLIKKFIINIFKIIVHIIAVFLTLTVLEMNINGLMAGLGVGSAIIALAVQDVFKNIIAGSSIIAEKPFIIGDFISLEGSNFSMDTSGTVEDISLRSTTIRRLDNSLLNIPNFTIATSSVNNISTINTRRIEINLKLPIYLNSDDIERIKGKIYMVFSNDSKVLAETVVVALNKISNEGYNLYVYCYINESRYVQYLKQQDKMLSEIIDIMNSENIEFQNQSINVYQLEKTKEKRKPKALKSPQEEKKEKRQKNNIKIRNI